MELEIEHLILTRHDTYMTIPLYKSQKTRFVSKSFWIVENECFENIIFIRWAFGWNIFQLILTTGLTKTTKTDYFSGKYLYVGKWR